MYARIIEGRVAESTEAKPELGASECAVIVETHEWDVRPGWVFEGGALVPPPAPAEPDPYAAEPEYLDLGQISIGHAERLYAAAQAEAANTNAEGKPGDGAATVLLEILGL